MEPAPGKKSVGTGAVPNVDDSETLVLGSNLALHSEPQPLEGRQG